MEKHKDRLDNFLMAVVVILFAAMITRHAGAIWTLVVETLKTGGGL